MAKGLCRAHYQQMWMHGETTMIKDAVDTSTGCTIDSCDRDYMARGLCQAHYAQVLKHGEIINEDIKVVTPIYVCTAEGCEEEHHAQGFCNTHYRRFLKYGRVDLKRRSYNLTDKSSSAGYRLLSKVGHPIADKAGRISEHRLILYDKIGPGKHKCHWCPTIISWEDKTLTCDHLDFNRKNNDPSNLEPSCLSCNSGRTLFKGMEVDG